jgi:metallophosphoesterase superfamily enzyme
LEKYFSPTHLDKSPYGYIWKVINEDKTVDIYLQVNEDSETPNWIKLGDIFEKIFKNLIQKEQFIKELLNLYELKEVSTDHILQLITTPTL